MDALIIVYVQTCAHGLFQIETGSDVVANL